MKSISIFGLGHVGTVTAACLASRGHTIIGVDPNPLKVQRIDSGMSPIVEPGVQKMIATASSAGLIGATQNAAVAIERSEVSFISVGTPCRRNGQHDLSQIHAVCADIGHALRDKSSLHWIVVRNTVLPGTTENVIIPAIESASGKKAGRDFVVCFNPEFLRGGSAVVDFFNPSLVVIGAANLIEAAPIRELYSFLDAEVYETSIQVAEMIKYCCNAFHALKVAFANEIGSVCNSIGIDAKVVTDIFKSDARLNISSAYLTPGFAFGGSSLPNDLRALIYRVRELDLKLPLLESIIPSNTEQINRAAEAILGLPKRKIAVLGLSFKAGTDDLRESPMVHLVKRLIAEGCDVRIWDQDVAAGRLIGSNRDFIEACIPHIGTLLRDNFENVLAHAEVVVLGPNFVRRDELMSRLNDDQYLIDLSNLVRPVVKETQAAAAWSGG